MGPIGLDPCPFPQSCPVSSPGEIGKLSIAFLLKDLLIIIFKLESNEIMKFPVLFLAHLNRKNITPTYPSSLKQFLYPPSMEQTSARENS